jgi:hypothetical protein
VIADIEAIENYGSDENYGGVRWRKAFEHAYGVSIDDIKDVPIKFCLTLNRRASITHMPTWKNDTNRREILGLCNEIIQAWKDKKADLLEEKSESLGWFKQLETIWGRWEPL